MKHYYHTAGQVLESLGTGEEGLTGEAAAGILASHGRNRLQGAKKDSLVKRLLKQMADPMIIMLIIAAVISSVTSVYQNEPMTDVFIILFVVVLNAVLGVLQESKAEKAIEALRRLSSPTSKVLRSGEVTVIDSEEIVPGDIVIVEAGDSVPADGRIIEAFSLKAEESPLTGESVPVSKFSESLNELSSGIDIPLGDRKNMLYTGTTVAYGRGRYVVTATGMDTEMGKIADALANTAEGETPLQKKLAALGTTLSKVVVAISVFVFIISLVQSGDFSGASVLHVFMIAVALAVAAIPEGLPAVVTIVLSMGVTKMSKRSAIIRKLMAVESLGSTQIICSDKTGTLTQNRMTVTKWEADDEVRLAECLALCNDARIVDGVQLGDPTETALIVFAGKFSLTKEGLSEAKPRIGEAPFDSVRKMMSTLHDAGEAGVVQFTKGAPDNILTRCDRYLDQGEIKELDEPTRERFLKKNIEYADEALRVLAGACKNYDALPAFSEPEEIEEGMIYLGLAGMQDPSRPEVADAILRCREAGITPIMITGDHLNTAVAIALELGIITDRSQAMTGEDLSGLTDEELEKRVESTFVYARVQPDHKVRIVKAWQKRNKVTAMTGDGVNDAPSIKAADVGVGMGITGTDVTKGVADMVLADDNFATIVTAIEEGRKIYENIRKVLLFQLSTNLAEVILVFASSIMGFNIFETAHLLWINLVTDTAPGLALGTESAEDDIMKRPPRQPDESIFHGCVADIAVQAVFLGIIVMASYFIGQYIETGSAVMAHSMDGQTMAFLTMSLAETFHALNMRSQRKSIFTLRYHNRYLYAATILSAALTAMVVFVPFLADAFGFAHITLTEYMISLGLSVMIIPLVEASKLITRKVAHKG